MLFKHILSIYGSFKHMSEMLKSETTHYMEEEEEELTVCCVFYVAMENNNNKRTKGERKMP